jgi:uncharacterized protein (TIGR02246 family)
MTQESAFRSWLDRYGQAWEAQDPEMAAGLFTEDATYAWGPFTAPIQGRNAIRQAWERATGENQKDIRFGYEMLGVTNAGDGIARWWAQMAALPTGTPTRMEGIFLISMNDTKTCQRFREWWNEDPPATGASEYR